MSVLDPALLATLLDRLARSRGALLASLEGVTERDFGVEIEGQSVVRALASLAAAERAATAAAAGTPVTERVVDRPMPPQVVHALAGARYATRTYLASDGAKAATAEALVARLVEREEAMAARIVARPRLEPPPVFPMVEPRGPQPGEPPRNFVR